MAPGVDNAQQGGLAAPRKRKVSTQAIALGVLLAIGGGMIYGMRLLGIGPMTRIVSAAIPDYDLTKPSARGPRITRRSCRTSPPTTRPARSPPTRCRRTPSAWPTS